MVEFSPSILSRTNVFSQTHCSMLQSHFLMPNYFWGVTSLLSAEIHFPNELDLSVSFKIRLFVIIHFH